jgi:hypothetical protein
MDGQTDLGIMEREAYRAYWSDGIVDIYLGLSLAFMGVMWTWPNGLSAIAGVLPAIFVTPMLVGRRRFVEARLGHVEWRPARRGWEYRNQLLLLAAGVGLFLLAVVVYATVVPDGSGDTRFAPGILAWLLALLALGLAILFDARRMLSYAAVLAVGGFAAVALQTEPGWPISAAGIVATIVGLVMLRRFVARYPVIDQP